ncbi:alkaline phosphatase family protein [Ferruginivarius sediminum]|uniref:Alkaline phosphatase family protein n=1 Tax=Ferruginivarius sediminum TaxID=2661937 RepID=A0A369TE89_9PROT|nr:nucleotide pyrophosphatase/phosphodiesterase family protein [Ferruginivarius sediminum]RDD62685.1 alkaline phosphatase family protein [Ferruginivarius sediminum]
MRRTIVIDIVGLTPSLLGENTPNLSALARKGALRPLDTVTPAVTTTVQSTFLTGEAPGGHGIVANGWYFHDLAQIWFWRQSNHLVQGEKLWDAARRRDPSFTCANLFWWYNMYSGADIGVTPRPMYPADGRKIPDCYAEPPELRDALTRKFGLFPLFRFWGPATDIAASEWIVNCALDVLDNYSPTLSLVYIPHLDYNLQRLGPDHPDLARDLKEVDDAVAPLLERAEREDMQVVVLSEYGITPVDKPVHINRALREAGFIRVREELGRELLDPGASRAFAVADHQIAHVYVKHAGDVPAVRDLLQSLDGVEHVLDEAGKRDHGLDHARSGNLVALARQDAWFTYYYWLDDNRCPDFAPTVDIHRKPGFDPVELFFDPKLPSAKLSVGWRLLKKKLGLRTLMDVIPLDATLVKGSHGRITDDPQAGPLFLSSRPDLVPEGHVAATGVKDLILRHIFDGDEG